MKFLALCFLEFVLLCLFFRWNYIISMDYTKEHKSKLCKRVAWQVIIIVCLIFCQEILVCKEIFN